MDIQNLSDTSADTRRLRVAFTVALSFALLPGVLKLAEYLSGLDFTQFGIYPRRAGSKGFSVQVLSAAQPSHTFNILFLC
jgi:hypothetical protein